MSIVCILKKKTTGKNMCTEKSWEMGIAVNFAKRLVITGREFYFSH